MKLKELLDEKGLSDSISKNLEEALFSKINSFIIDLIIKQNNIDISSFIQRLASLLNSDYQKELVSTVNFISVNNIINKPLLKTGIDFSSKMSEQFSKTMDIKISENLKNQISDSIKSALSAEISDNDELTHKITQRLNIDLKEQIKEQLNQQFHGQTENNESNNNSIKSESNSIKEALKSNKSESNSSVNSLESTVPSDWIFNSNQASKYYDSNNNPLPQHKTENVENNSSIPNYNDNYQTRTIIQTIQQVGSVALLPDGTPDYTIDESGTALGITIGRTTRMEVLNIMKNFSSINNSQALSKQLNYEDVGLSIVFNEQKIVKGLTFSKKYKGSTSGGLKIGDRLEKAIEIYGSPQYKTAYNAVWKEIALFCEEANVVSSIRLQV